MNYIRICVNVRNIQLYRIIILRKGKIVFSQVFRLCQPGSPRYQCQPQVSYGKGKSIISIRQIQNNCGSRTSHTISPHGGWNINTRVSHPLRILNVPCNSSFADQKISLGRCPSTMAFLSLFFNQTNLPMSLGNLQPTLLPSNYITSHSLFYLHCLSTIKHCAILMPFIHNWTANLQQNFMMFARISPCQSQLQLLL